MNSRATAMFFSRSLRRESSSFAISVPDRLLSNVLAFFCTVDIRDQRAIAYDQSKPGVPHQRREQEQTYVGQTSNSPGNNRILLCFFQFVLSSMGVQAN